MRLALVLALSAGCAAAEAVPQAPPVPTLDARVQAIQITQRVWFEEDGSSRDDQNSMSVQVRGKINGRIAGWGRPRLTEAVLDTGERLVSSRSDEDMGMMDAMSRRGLPMQAAQQLDFQLELVPPAKPARRLASLKGSIEVTLAVGKPQAAEIGPVRDFIGKRLAIDGVENAEVTVVRADGKMVELELPRATERLLASVTFKDAAGNEIEQRGSGWNSSGNQRSVRRQYHVPLPLDGTVVVQLHRDLKTVSVPFAVADVPMPGANAPATTPPTVIKAKEVDEPRPELKARETGAAPPKSDF